MDFRFRENDGFEGNDSFGGSLEKPPRRHSRESGNPWSDSVAGLGDDNPPARVAKP
jgi:hypothetical protein